MRRHSFTWKLILPVITASILGIFISGFCKDQIVSFILTIVACFAFYLIGLEFIAASIDGWIPGLGTFLEKFFGMTGHFSSFERGVISFSDLLYFLSDA